MNPQKHTNIATLSMGTESEYSATSPDVVQQGGGLLSFLSGSDEGVYASNLALDAFNKKMPQVACFVIRNALNNSYALDFSKTNSSGKNLLHLIVIYSAYHPETKQLLLDILTSQNVKNYLNVQDSTMNTPCHYALSLGMEDVVKLFANLGADLTIKNEDGLSIALKSVPVRQEPIINVNLPRHSKSDNSDIFVKIANDTYSSDDENVGARLDRIVKLFTNKYNDQDSAETIDFRRDLVTKSSDGPIAKQPQRVPIAVNTTEQSDGLNSEDVLNMIMNDFKQGRTQQGGGSKNIAGSRKIVTYSETFTGGSTTEGTATSDDADSISSMARAVENKASEAHKRAVDRIKELLSVDEAEAKAYKAFLYDAIKKDSPQLSNYDRAIELEKRASDKKILDKISKTDIKNMLKTIEAKQKERASNSSSTSEEKSDKKKRTKKVPISEGSSTDSGLETMSTIEM